jgi:hypothetical protein
VLRFAFCVGVQGGANPPAIWFRLFFRALRNGFCVSADAGSA